MEASTWARVIELVVTVFVAVGASSGFWAYMEKRSNRSDARTQLLLGLAHDRIVFLGMNYIERGWLTHAEYDDFNTYLYVPYSAFGGNGLAKKVFDQVTGLPMYKSYPPRKDIHV